MRKRYRSIRIREEMIIIKTSSITQSWDPSLLNPTGVLHRNPKDPITPPTDSPSKFAQIPAFRRDPPSRIHAPLFHLLIAPITDQLAHQGQSKMLLHAAPTTPIIPALTCSSPMISQDSGHLPQAVSIITSTKNRIEVPLS